MTNDAIIWVAKGFTDDVTSCEHCGRQELKGTVRMVATGPDGDDEGESFMGVVCAAKMTGRKAAEIRTEAQRADRARIDAIRNAHRAWSNAHTDWFCAERDKALGPGARFREIDAWHKTPEVQAAEAAWRAEHPEPPQHWGM